MKKIFLLLLISAIAFGQSGRRTKVREQDLAKPLKNKISAFDSLTISGTNILIWNGGNSSIVAEAQKKSVADTTALKALSADSNFTTVTLGQYNTANPNIGNGIFTLLSTSYSTDKHNIFSAPGGKQWVRITAPDVPDTTVLKKLPPIYPDGYAVSLDGLSSSNNRGGGVFVLSNSSYPTGGVAFTSSISGKQWVRESFNNFNRANIEWFGAIPDDSAKATTNRIAIQAAIDLVFISNYYGEVIIPAGIFWVNAVPSSNPAYCIDLKTVHISGISTHPSTHSAIKMADNQNATVLYTKTVENSNEWWHHGRLENLNVICNGDNNTVANGIFIYKSGEVSYIRSVQINKVKGFGLKLGGSAHDFIENVTIFSSTSASHSILDKERIGFWFNGSGQRTIHSISGDNLNPIVYTTGSVNFEINGIKFENSSVSDTLASLVWIDTSSTGVSPDGNVSRVAIRNVKVDAATFKLHSIFRVNTKNPNLFPSLGIESAMLTGYDSLLVSNSNSKDIGFEGQIISGIFISGNTQATNTFYSSLRIGAANYFQFESINNPGTYPGHIRLGGADWIFKAPRYDFVFRDSTSTDLLRMSQSSGVAASVDLSTTGRFKVGSSGGWIDVIKVVGTAPSDSIVFQIGGVEYAAPRR